MRKPILFVGNNGAHIKPPKGASSFNYTRKLSRFVNEFVLLNYNCETEFTVRGYEARYEKRF